MNAPAANSTASSPFPWKALAVVVSLFLLPIGLVFLWYSSLGFGKSEMTVLLITFVIGSLGVGLFCDMLFGHRYGPVFLLAVFFNMFVSLALMFVPVTRDSNLAYMVEQRLQDAEKNLPKAPAIAADIRSVLSSPKAVAAQRESLKELRFSQTQPSSITAFVVNAEKFEVDATFVKANGMIRQQDWDRLKQRVSVLAKEGNPEAQLWLKAHAKTD